MSHDFAPLYSEDEQLALEAGSFDPGRLWWSIRRHWLIVVVLPIVAAAAAYAYTSAQPDVFEAEAALIVQPTYAQAELGIDVRQASDPEREVANEAAIVEGAGIARIVDDELGTDVSYRAEVPDGTDIIVITAQAPTAEEAAAAANGIADFYLRERAPPQRAADLDETTGDLQEAIAAFEIELGEIDASSATAPDDQALAAQRDAVLAELTLTRTELESLRRQRATSDPGARIVSEAEVPDEPVAPNPTRTAVLVGLVTLAIGLAVAWFRARDPEPSSQPNPAVAPAPTLDAPSEDPDPAADTVGLWEEAGAPAFMVPIDASPHERAVLFERIADDIIPEPHALPRRQRPTETPAPQRRWPPDWRSLSRSDR